MSEESHQLLNVLDALIHQKSTGRSQDANSLNALLRTVLPSYSGHNLGPDDVEVLLKIFQALRLLFSRSPSLMIEGDTSKQLVSQIMRFFDSMKYPPSLSKDASATLIQIMFSCFSGGKLRGNKYLLIIREHLMDTLKQNLTVLLRSIISLKGTDGSNQMVMSANEMIKSNDKKLSTLSACIWILRVLVDQSLSTIFMLHMQSSMLLNNLISRIYFCMDNIVVNLDLDDDLDDDDQNVLSQTSVPSVTTKLDQLYAILLSCTTDHFYNDPDSQTMNMDLALSRCKHFLTWPLLIRFPALQAILSESLLKLFLKCQSLGNQSYFWNKSDIVTSKVEALQEIIDQSICQDLRIVICFLLTLQSISTANKIATASELSVKPFTNQILDRLRKRILMTLGVNLTPLLLDYALKLTDGKNLIFLNHDYSEVVLLQTVKAREQPVNGEMNVDKWLERWHENLLKLLKTNPSKILGTITGKLYLLTAIGRFCCLSNGDFDLNHSYCENCDLYLQSDHYLKNAVNTRNSPLTKNPTILSLYGIIVSKFLAEPIENNENVHITVLLTLIRIFRTYCPPLVSKADPLWQYIEKCFVSVAREIRLLSVKLLPLIVSTSETEVYETNFDLVVGMLSSFKPTKDNKYLFEGIIMSWGELLMVANLDPRLYILLNPLIQFMGDSDEFRSNLALHEIRIVASTRSVTPWKLAEPFIPLISCDLVKRHTSNPGLLSIFCQCIKMDTYAFLSRTQSYTVPRFIQYFDDDHIGYLAKQLGKTRTTLVQNNLNKVLAVLMTSDDEISPVRITKILSIYIQGFKGIDFESIICSLNILDLIWEILSLYNCTDKMAKRIRSAVLFVCVARHQGSHRRMTRQEETGFLDSEMNLMVLGIAQHFSDIIHNNRGSKPFLEKVEAIRAIRCLGTISPSFEACLSQIMTCLQIALESTELQYESLECLNVIVSRLEYSKLSIIIDLVISYIIQKYDSFNGKCKIIAQNILKDIFRKDPKFSKEHPSYIYSLAVAHPELSNIINRNIQLTKELRVSGILGEFCVRLQSENKWIVLDVLDDLTKFFEIRQFEIQKHDINDGYLSARFSLLIANLLRASSRFSFECINIPRKCSMILAMIGALDFSKFGSFFQRKRKNVILPSNLSKRREIIDFSAYFLNNYLVKCFIASTDPQKQLFLAYAMQEYLKFLKIDTRKIVVEGSKEQMFWSKLSNLSQTVLRPLLNSRYKKGSGKRNGLIYPRYKKNMKYSKWITDVTEDLLHTASSTRHIPEGARRIFAICSDIIKGQDLSISEFLLPYVSLMVVEYGDDKSYANIETEIDTILNISPEDMDSDSSVENLKSCYRMVFSTIDYFREWIAESKMEGRHKHSEKHAEERKRAEKFLSNIPSELLAKRTAECNFYERAIFNLEDSYQHQKIPSNEFFGTIRHMYAAIDDLDALQGVLKKFSTDTLDDKLLQFQYSEDWEITHESLAAMADTDDTKTDTNHSVRVTSLLKSLDDHCEYDKVLLELHKYEELMLGSDTVDLKDLYLCGLQASIFTGNLSELEKWVRYSERTTSITSPGSDLSIYYEFAQALSRLHTGEMTLSKQHLEKAVTNVGLALSVSKDISHTKIANYMTLLHCLYDCQIMSTIKSPQSLDSSRRLLKFREDNTMKDFRTRWKIHSVRRSIEKIHPTVEVREQLGNTLVESSQLLRESGRLDLATKSITHALTLGTNNSAVNFEFSKLLWAQGQHRQALRTLKSILKGNKDPEIQLKYTQWLESSGNGSSDEIVNGYKSVATAKSLEECGKAHYYLGRYYNKLLDAQAVDTPGLKRAERDFYGDLEYKVIKAYMRSASFSNVYLFEVLPKAVTIWLDYASKYRDVKLLKPYSGEIIMAKRKDNYVSVLKFIKTCAQGEIDTYKWYTVLSQLISRMGHRDPKTESLIIGIITELASKYPQVILYSVYAQMQSNSAARRKKGERIFKNLENGPTNITPTQLHTALELLDAFKGICQGRPSRSVRGKLRLWEDLHFSFKRGAECNSLALPIRANFDQLHSSMVLSHSKGNSNKQHANTKFITFLKFDPQVTILESMQRPRKVYIIGTDMRKYSILCKPNDDLRKDGKLMEFATVMDRLLRNDFESEKRDLSITSYAVVPLNESMGLIEMVDNVRTIRNIMLTYLQLQGTKFDFAKVKTLLGDQSMPLEGKLRNFRKLIQMYPPVLQIWFADRFPNPVDWYSARNRYTRSCAVMSIVGYLLGMGDRHGDNILLNETTGQILHVDFDCLFDKGKKLQVPERVPFRLTQNMTTAMGVNGYEGTFRRSCEVTMNLIRQNENTLMNILETFLYDPILDWKKSSKKRRGTDKNSDSNAKLQPQVAMNTIRRKIKGILDPRDLDTGAKDSGGLSVSVNAQVEAVIQQATSEENLARMYVGWMAFL